MQKALRYMAQFTLRRRWLFVLGALCGLFFFSLFYGFAVVNPMNISWLMAGGDLSQHYLGWAFYRQSAWSFPLGSISDLAYPHPMSVVFMDALPLFAIPFKLLGTSVGADFQYFGIWGLLPFMLQGGMMALIVSRWIKNPFIILAAAGIAVLSPIMLSRVFTHTALSGQWVLLLAILLLLELRTGSFKKAVIYWTATLVLSVAIHPYLTVGVAVLFVIWLILRKESIARRITGGAVAFGTTAVAFWVIGGLMVRNVSAGGLGEYGYSLISLIDSSGWSQFIPRLGTNFEGTGYAGLGVLLLVGVAAVLLIKNRKEVSRPTLRTLLVITSLIVLLILAVSPVVKVGAVTLFEYSVPAIVEKVWSIFRATGRLAWPLYYLLLIGSFYAIIRFTRARVALLVISCAFVVQLIDVVASPAQQAYTQRITAAASDSVREVNNAWSPYIEGKQHLFFVGTLSDPREFQKVGAIALHFNTTLNTGYFARAQGVAIESSVKEAEADLLSRRMKPDTLYVTRNEELLRALCADGYYEIEKIDEYWVVSQGLNN